MTDGCYMCEVRMYDEIDVHSFEFVITPKISIRDDCMRLKHQDRYLNVTTYRFDQTVRYFN
jgi:hypothetical protein